MACRCNRVIGPELELSLLRSSVTSDVLIQKNTRSMSSCQVRQDALRHGLLDLTALSSLRDAKREERLGYVWEVMAIQ